MSALRWGGIVAVVGAVVASPLARPRGWDSFPVSSFPMFSRGDLGNVRSLAHVLLVLPDGTERPASPALVGSPEPMIAMAIVANSVQRGTAAALCAAVAGRAREATSVLVATSAYDTRAYFANGHRPLSREIHARCRVSAPP